MSETHNERGSAVQLRVGLIADAERLGQLAEVVRSYPWLGLLGQAGMPQTSALPEVPWFDDGRVLIAQAELQAILLATSTRADAELGNVALQRGLHVWRVPPLARSFAEAAEITTQVRKQPVVYRVASPWEHVASHAWQELNWPADFQPQVSELTVRAPGPPVSSWRSKAGDAAGGVLAQPALHLLEALVAQRGLPESLAAVVSRQWREAGGAGREVEDVALAVLRYPNGGTAVIQALWDRHPTEQRLVHHGQELSAMVSDQEVALVDRVGKTIDRHPYPGDYLAADLHQFVEMVKGAARERAAAALDRHVAVQALLETIYLAARTNHPESPRKLYEVQGWPPPRP